MRLQSNLSVDRITSSYVYHWITPFRVYTRQIECSIYLIRVNVLVTEVNTHIDCWLVYHESQYKSLSVEKRNIQN